MAESSYSEILRDLSRDYYHRRISVDEYRSKRREVLDAVDQQYNSVDVTNTPPTSPGSQYDNQSMTTVFYGPTDTQPNYRNKD